MGSTQNARPSRHRSWWLGPCAAMVAMAGMVELGVVWLRREERAQRDRNFQAQIKILQEGIAQQINRAGDLLRSAQALCIEGQEPDQAGWDAFAQEVELETRFPAVRSIQWIPRVLRGELPAFEARMRKIHGADFRVWSLADGRDGKLPVAEAYFPIAAVSPLGRGRRGIGFDVYSQASVRDQVVDVILRQQTMRLGSRRELSEEPGAIVFDLTGPLYGRPIGAEEDFLTRRDAMRGLMVCTFDGGRFFRALADSLDEPLAFAVFEGQGPSPQGLIWSALPAPGGSVPGHERYLSLALHGRIWTLRIQTTPAWEAAQASGPAGLARGIGYALVFALGGLLLMLARARDRAVRLAGERAQELEERNNEIRKQSMDHYASERAREELLVVVNHGLRTPLTALRGALSVLNEIPGPPQETRSELLSQAARNAERALMLVNDLLDLHRLEQGKLPLEKVELNLRAVLQEAVQGVEGLARTQGRTLRIECPESLRISADPQRFHQVINNLLSNALRHGQRGTAIRIWAGLTAGERVRVSIHNLGEPLTESVRQRLFGHHGLLSSAGSRLPGLGLPIAKGLMEAMGGTMGHVFAEGGNTFWCELEGHG